MKLEGCPSPRSAWSIRSNEPTNILQKWCGREIAMGWWTQLHFYCDFWYWTFFGEFHYDFWTWHLFFAIVLVFMALLNQTSLLKGPAWSLLSNIINFINMINSIMGSTDHQSQPNITGHPHGTSKNGEPCELQDRWVEVRRICRGFHRHGATPKRLAGFCRGKSHLEVSWGFHSHGGTPNSWMVYKGQSQSKLDDEQG